MNKAVFFDRDGVLNKDIGYLSKIDDFLWIDGAIEVIKKYNDKKYYVFVITNQSGVARGYYTIDDVENLHRWMNEDLKKYNAHIDEFFYCPHYKNGIINKYSYECKCRKPKPKMINDACKKYNIDKRESFLVGDRDSDIECANNAGIKGLKFLGDNLLTFIINTVG